VLRKIERKESDLSWHLGHKRMQFKIPGHMKKTFAKTRHTYPKLAHCQNRTKYA